MGLFDFLNRANKKSENIQNDRKRSFESSIPQQNKSQNAQTTFASYQTSANAFPSKNGLYPYEILMLSYATTYKAKNNTFQSFWKWDYSIDDPQKILDSLYDRGFICYANTSKLVSNLRVAELKELLNKIAVNASGKKEELVSKVIDNYTPEEIDRLFPEKEFALTPLGENELSENEYIMYLHRHKYMTILEMNNFLNTNNPSTLGYRDIIWREFNKRSGEYFQNLEFGLYRNVRLNMHDFLCEEKKYKTALHLLIEVISFDLSGLGNKTEPIKLTENKFTREIHYESRLVNLFVSDDKKEIIVPPGIIKYFNNLCNKLDMTNDELIKYIYDEFAEVHIHERVFNETECANIILSLTGYEDRKIINSYDIAVRRLKKMFALN